MLVGAAALPVPTTNATIKARSVTADEVHPICPETCRPCCDDKSGFVKGVCELNAPGNACTCDEFVDEHKNRQPCILIARGDSRLLRMTPMLRSHDAATFFAGSNMVRAQDHNFQEQLEAGARAFDIRLAVVSADGKITSKFQHLPGAGPLSKVAEGIGVMWDQNVEAEMAVFEDWAKQHPDELVVIHISHCLIQQTFQYEDLTCLNGDLMDQFRNRNWAILNEGKQDGDPTRWKACGGGQCLEWLTFGDAKHFAATGEIGSDVVEKWNPDKDRVPGLLVIADEPFVNEQFQEAVHDDAGAMNNYVNGYFGDEGQKIDGKPYRVDWSSWFGTDEEKNEQVTNLEILQAHWQSSTGGLRPVPHDNGLNAWAASDENRIMQEYDKGKLNMLDMNWIGDAATSSIGAKFLQLATKYR